MLTEIEVAKKLLQINAIRLEPQNPFLWASGLYAPIYCDNRKTLSFPNIRKEIKNTLVHKAQQMWKFDMVAGVATAGIPQGVLIAEALDLPFVYVRSTSKKHGAKNQVEGDIAQGKNCLVVEDLISTGGSSLEAVEVLRKSKLNVAGVIAIFTYGLRVATDNFIKANCPLTTISSYEALMRAASEMNIISDNHLLTLQHWRSDPKAWSQAFKSKQRDI